MSDRNVALFERARRHIPGGVNSPVRAFRSVGGAPRFFVSGNGARATDVNGDEYLDYVGSWGPLILGHAHPKGVAASDAPNRVQGPAIRFRLFEREHGQAVHLRGREVFGRPGAANSAGYGRAIGSTDEGGAKRGLQYFSNAVQAC